tara:strand:+ start:499 stop:819 length:321 start_codon:yes stop_codon:yes gene_type:complete
LSLNFKTIIIIATKNKNRYNILKSNFVTAEAFRNNTKGSTKIISCDKTEDKIILSDNLNLKNFLINNKGAIKSVRLCIKTEMMNKNIPLLYFLSIIEYEYKRIIDA